MAAVDRVLRSQALSDGVFTVKWKAQFAAYLARKHAVAVLTGTIGHLVE
ncbi:DegT/DnrJ/EryC1/StrS family aminotransferase [Bradyrhizobium sp. BR 1432]